MDGSESIVDGTRPIARLSGVNWEAAFEFHGTSQDSFDFASEGFVVAVRRRDGVAGDSANECDRVRMIAVLRVFAPPLRRTRGRPYRFDRLWLSLRRPADRLGAETGSRGGMQLDVIGTLSSGGVTCLHRQSDVVLDRSAGPVRTGHWPNVAPKHRSAVCIGPAVNHE